MAPNDDVPHGNLQTYVKRGCRCEDCREANNVYGRRKRAERRQSIADGGMPTRLHGTVTGYSNYCCRCDGCRGASAAAKLARRRVKGVQPRRDPWAERVAQFRRDVMRDNEIVRARRVFHD